MASVKLTLSVDRSVVIAAKRYAAEHGTSVSRLVEDYLSAVVQASRSGRATPVLSRLRGSLGGAERDAWREHLERKYR